MIEWLRKNNKRERSGALEEEEGSLDKEAHLYPWPHHHTPELWVGSCPFYGTKHCGKWTHYLPTTLLASEEPLLRASTAQDCHLYCWEDRWCTEMESMSLQTLGRLLGGEKLSSGISRARVKVVSQPHLPSPSALMEQARKEFHSLDVNVMLFPC